MNLLSARRHRTRTCLCVRVVRTQLGICVPWHVRPQHGASTRPVLASWRLNLLRGSNQSVVGGRPDPRRHPNHSPLALFSDQDVVPDSSALPNPLDTYGGGGRGGIGEMWEKRRR